jgi:hypothetical protein
MARPDPTIVGAGFAGLLAAYAWQRSDVLEREPAPTQSHHAVLRFRSDSVSQLTGIPFRRVRVHKGIWSGAGFVPPSIRAANLYARKVIGFAAGDRSIWNIEPADRFIAPHDFYEQMVNTVWPRISWGREVPFGGVCAGVSQIINTSPLHAVCNEMGMSIDNFTFSRAPISVAKFTVPRADVFQTVYFPDHATPVYRASLTGDMLAIEYVHWSSIGLSSEDVELVARAFGLGDLVRADATLHHQRYGKIAPMDDGPRRALLHELSARFGIYSLGRFATWRNVLLDDVVHDISVIKRLLTATEYDRALMRG